MFGYYATLFWILFKSNRKWWAFFFLVFNWTIFALQYCVGFCHYQHESARGIHTPPPSWTSSHLPPPPPPTSYSKFPLANYFTYCNVYASILLSQFVPASPSPTGPTKVCSLCLCSHCCPANRFISTIFLDSIHRHWCTVFVLSLTHLTMYNRFQVHPLD